MLVRLYTEQDDTIELERAAEYPLSVITKTDVRVVEDETEAARIAEQLTDGAFFIELETGEFWDFFVRYNGNWIRCGDGHRMKFSDFQVREFVKSWLRLEKDDED